MAISPHRPSRIATGTTALPTGISERAITAISSGIAINVRYSPFFSRAPINNVPPKPATPITSKSSDSIVASTFVTVSRNGLR
ncbi:hypothetical protein D3C80_1210880 [compost metagenome]